MRNSSVYGSTRFFLATAVVLIVHSVFVQQAHAWAWATRDASRQSSETPSIYLGDSIEFHWDINDTGWGASYKKAGAGSADASGSLNWQDIVWHDDAGDGFGNPFGGHQKRGKARRQLFGPALG